ncbi:microtubule-actin cross-linking factor 1 isoform X27 [Hermetia illucens]|uniref:microtubule-actin cross-linking factor 1 isoform X27 n=1 Tax=Hermetia illucens TaxID=343691 RepID=UPI0018CC26FB|nr:microtubule-actin cross-linking factor 1 isoform X27 [Hermetia illucens]
MPITNNDEYDFAFEFKRYAESLQKPLRTYRVEFNLGAPAGDGVPSEDIYTTSYSQTQFSTSKTTSSKTTYDQTDYLHRIESSGSREGSPTKKVRKHDMQSDIHQRSPDNASSVQFTEIRSQKRVERNHESVGTDSKQLLDMPGIVDPKTGRILTVGEAIHMRILDVRTGEIIVNEQRITIQDAARKGAIDPNLAENLLQPGAVIDHNGRHLSLLEIIQKEITDAENGYETAEKRIKVKTQIEEGIGEDEAKSIADAIAAGQVDPKTGVYRIKTGQTISIAEAYERGYLRRHESVTIKSNALSLSDAIQHGLVDNSGWISDRNSGDKFRLDSAISNNLIDPNIREVVDAKNDVKVTLNEALKAGILNAKTGRYMNAVTKEKLTFVEAKNRQLIVKPFTLKDVCDLNLIDKNGKITSPMRREKLSIIQAMEAGVLDSDNVKCVTKQKGELITLSEAIADGVILPAEAKYRDSITGEIMSIPDAVDRGLISSVSQKSIFNIDGFKDPYSGEFVSFNAALGKDVLRRKNGEFLLDAGKGNFVDLKSGIEAGLVRPEVFEMLNRPVGVQDASGRELTVLDLVYLDLIDPKSGYLLDPNTKAVVPLDTAIERKFITPEGALLISSLLNITLTTETVTKTIKRYVTVTSEATGGQEEVVLTFTEAVRQGFIDENRQLFKDPKTGEIFSVQQALAYGLLLPDSDETVPQPSSRKQTKSTITIVTKSFLPELEPEQIELKSKKVIQKSVDFPIPQKADVEYSTFHTTTETKVQKKRDSKTVVSEFINVERQGQQNITERQLYEMPPEGWFLSDAIEQKLFDPVTGLFIIPGTDRLVSFQECIQLQIINRKSVEVLDPKNNRRVTVGRSFEKKILDSTGHYNDNGNILNMKEAINSGKIILECPMEVDKTNQRLIQITKVTGQPDLVEVSVRLDENPPQFVQIKGSKSNLSSPEPVQIGPGAIYDPSTALVIFPQSGKSANIISAVSEGKVDSDLVKIADPKTGKQISVREAIKKRIVDPNTGEIVDKSGKKIDLINAVKTGALVVVGAPLVAIESALQSLKFIVDPKTGEKIPVEVAVERGLISRDQVSFDSTSSTPSTRSPEKVKTMTIESISLDDESLPSEGERTRARITTEPKYLVSIGKAKSVTQSPEKEAKLVVLQKMRKQIVQPRDALQKGMIDQETADILENKANFTSPEGDILSISEAIEQNLIDGQKGKIIDPQRGDTLNIQQAIERGILDADGTNHLLIPLAKSLSVPQLIEQGLIDPNDKKIFHPETGTPLSVKEAIICEVLDPLSKLQEPKVTLENAIESGIIDGDKSLVSTKIGSVDLLEAASQQVFDNVDNNKSFENIPPVGMTFPVGVKKGLIDVTTKEIIHPITGEKQPLQTAIESNFIMAIPHPPSADNITLEEAIDSKLVDADKGVIKHPKTGELVPIKEAVESGLLTVKPLPEFVASHSTLPLTTVTETVTSVHTVTTKTISLLQGYVMVSSNKVQNTSTGEIISIEEAKRQGIIKDESEIKESFATKEIKQSFADALKQGLVNINEGTYTDPQSGEKITIQQAVSDGKLDINPESSSEVVEENNLTITQAYQNIYDEQNKQFRDPKNPERLVTLTDAMKEGIIDPQSRVYDIPTGKMQTLEESVKQGLIDAKTGEVKQKSGVSVNVKEAAKLGLLAVVGAPVLAGMAVAGAVKKVVGKKDKSPESPIAVEKPVTKKQEPQVKDVKLPKQKEPSPTEIVPPKPSERKTVETVDIPKHVVTTIDKSLESVSEVPAKIEKPTEEPKVTQTTVITEVKSPVSKESYTLETISEKPSVAETITVTTTTTTTTTTTSPEEAEPQKQVEQVESTQHIADYFNPEKLAEIGAYDTQTGHFLDPATGQRVTFQTLIYELNIFDPAVIFVKNFSTGNYDTLEYALERPLLDKNTGHMVDPKTGKKIPFFECVNRQWIIQDTSVLEKTPPADHIIDPETGYVILEDGRKITIAEALNNGDLDIQSISVHDPGSGEVIPLRMAIELGFVDLKRGTVYYIETGQEITITEAFKLGIIIQGSRKPISLEAAVKKGLYDPESGKLYDSESQNQVDVQKSIEIGLVDPKISIIVDAKTQKPVDLNNAIESKLVESETGRIKDTKTNEMVPFNIGIERQILQTENVIWSLMEVMQKEFYNRATQMILNPITGEEITLRDAIDSGFVEVDSCLVRDEKNDRLVPAKRAIKDGLLSEETGMLTYPLISLDEAYQKGYLISTKLPLSIVDCLLRGLYDPNTGKFTIEGRTLTIAEAIKDDILSPNELIILDPKTNNVISLVEAIKLGYLDPEAGVLVDPYSGLKLTLTEALENRILIPPKRKRSIPDAVYRGLYDPKTGEFSNTVTREKLSTERAIRRGVLDPESTIVNISGTILPFELAVENGLIDAKRGIVTENSGRKIDFREAFDRGILVEVKKPIGLSEAVVKNVYEEDTGLFMDPKTGLKLTFAEVVEQKMIDPESVQIRDFKTGLYKDIDLAHATETGVIDGKNAKVVYNNQKITLKHAFDVGILADSKAPISIQRAIHQGLYDDKTGKIVEPKSGRKITLHEAMRRFIINPQLPCYFDDHNEKLMSLTDTCRAGLIDRREGVFREPGSDLFIPLNEAMTLGLLVDIESAGFGLYELLSMGLYDIASRRIVHPVCGRQLTLREACVEDVVSISSSLIKNPLTGKYIRLGNAIQEKLIDDLDGTYVVGHDRKIDLQQARAKGWIVSNRKLLTMEMAIRMQLFRPDTGKFVDPSSGEYYDLLGAIECGLIDPDTTVFKNLVTGADIPLREAITNGDIDIQKGRVLDPKTKTSYNYDIAVNRGLLVTVLRPLTERPITRRDSVDLLGQSPISKMIIKPREMSLDEAIRYEIVNPETAVIKNQTTFNFIPLKLAIERNLVDIEKRTLVDPKALFFAFDPSLIVYVREPVAFEKAVETGCLDLSTGKLTYPPNSVSALEPAATSPATETDTSSPTPEEPKIYSLKDATTLGILDPDTALIKDGAKLKLVRLSEAFRKGLMDSDKANVLDTKTSKLLSLQQAYETGLLITPKRSFGLIEAITYNLYNPTTGGFNDPFQTTSDIINRKRLTLADAIASGLVDPTTTMVRDPNNSDIVPLVAAISSGLIDPITGRLIDSYDKNNSLDLVKANEKGLLLPAEQRQAVIEKFNLCEEALTGLLKWIATVEQKIARIGGPKEKVDDLRNQINSLKQIKDEIESQSRPVASCLEQVRQIVLTGGDVLSAPEVTTLENSGRELRSRVDRANDRTLRLLKRLESARDELTKLRSELDIFSGWLQTARRTLEDKERSLSDLTRLSSQSDSIREFVSDVIAHQADLRFITMAAQKFVDESKDFLQALNDFRTSLPDRLPHVEPLASSESPIRQEVSLVSAHYKDLLHRANTLSDRLSGLGGRQREYQDALDKARDWLRGVQPRVSSVLSDPVAADPQTVQDQMNEAKSLHNEFLTQGRLVDNAQQALDTLLHSLAGQLSPSEVTALEVPVEDLKDKYNQLLDALGDRCKLLDTALVQSQGVQDALDGLVGWVNQAEDKFKLQFRPASLIKERLQEQVREHRSLLADLQSHQASIDSVTASAQDLMASASNARLAKKIESKLADVTGKFEKLLDKVVKRGEFLDETLAQLIKFDRDSSTLEQELCNLQESLESRELASLTADDLANRMHEMSRMKDKLRPMYEDCTRLGKDLISQRDVTDTGPVRDRVKALENQWKNLDSSLDEKAKLSKQKAEHLSAYENLKDQVLAWLASMEARTNALAPVAVDVELMRQQSEELKPIIKDYRDYGTSIDKVNDLGAQYDALIRPDSPGRKRSSYSPIKRVSPLRRMSGDARTPSPTKGVHMSPSISPLSPGSSGFGSRRSSQDGFQISEMTPIQQQLSEINNRYGLIGVRLNDRQNELDTLREEVKKHQENLKTLSSFLDKIQRQVPKDSMGSKDEAERCTKQARKVLEDMYEKQSLLDSTKAQIRDLLRRKPDVPGADRLRSDLDTVADRWKNLSDLCKDRINFSEQLRDFLDTHNNMINWLDSKERMLTVLGPISSDPRMVQSQVQQVQVLREEFRTQQPQLNHLQDIGHIILDHLKESSPEGQAVSKKLRDVQSKWDDLVGRLDERANSLGAAADTSKEFDAGLSRLREALQTISDNLDALPTDRDHQENLRKIENLERQLEGQRPLLADAEEAANALCKVLGDAASRADVKARVGALEKQYQALQKKLDTRKAETEAALRDGRQFAESCSKTLGWLAGELSNLSDRLQVSAHKPTLQHQIDTHEPIYREVMAREHEIIMLLNKGKELTAKAGTTIDRSIQRDLERIQQQWEKLRRDAVDRHTRLQTCMEHCKKYGQTSETFLSWLRGAEDKLADLRPGSLKKSHLDQRLRELQAFRSEVWKHSGEYENTKSLGDTFLAACDVDKEPVKAEIQDIRERWEKLNNDLLNRAQELETCARRLGDFNDELRNLDHAVGRCEDRLAAHDSLGGAAKDPKLLERVKTIREDVNALKKPLQSLKSLAGDIISETRAAGGNADHISEDVDGIADRIDDLQNRLDDRCGQLQSAATAVSQFNEQVKKLGLDLTDLENAVDLLSPPAREVKVVMGQIKEVADILDKIDRTTEQLADVEKCGEKLVDSGFSPDTVQTREQIAGLKKTLGRLDNRSRDHEDALHSALNALQKFYDEHTGVLEDLKDISDQLKGMKPVSSELEQIRNQQEDFRKFRAREVEPVSQKIDEVNRAGRDLVRSAQSGVSTTQIEKDLEKLNKRWNDLKEGMNDRERRLDVALLQSGKFQEALDGLAKWLSDTEEMVANQKPPSSDYKVVKAQLQEQKFLKKMLLDRQNSMSSLFNLGQEVAANCAPSEKAAIERQLKELMSRFDALTDAAKAREQDLEQAMEVAKRFQDKLLPLVRWLDTTERAVKNMELIPTDEEKIQQRIREHDRLHDEIVSKRPDFTELADIAGQLLQLVGEDEAIGLGEKVRGTTERYTNLVEASENVGQLLAESRQGLRHLVLTYQDLVAWMESMEKELHRYRVVPVHTEKILEQMDHLVELNEDIANHAQNVESTVNAGSELMKHISADEAIQLKDKLDSLQRRYGELTNKGGDLLKQAQEALPLVQQFHDAHNRLVDWMQGAESVLATGEPRQADILRLETELSEMRPLLETLNLVGPRLCALSPGEGASTIESLVTRDNRRFDAIAEQIQRKAERLHLSNQRAREVTGDIDELLEWFRDMDANLRDADLPSMDPKVVRAQLQEHRSINDDVSSQKGRVRDVTATAKKVIRESPQNENTAALREKLEDLKEVVDTVIQLCGDRLSVLEQALPLSEHFADSHIGLSTWLDDMEHQISMLAMPGLRADLITAQQDKNERLLQSIAEHKPLLDKLNKTGETLAALVADDDAAKISEILDSDNARYAALKTELRERQQALENALQESSQFSDKLEGMLRALANTVEQVNQLDPISAMPQKIREQIDDNSALIDDLDKRGDAFAAVQRAANDVIAKAGNKSDPAVRDIKKKLDKLNNLWNDVQKATKKRGGCLDDTLAIAEKFWRQLHAVMQTLRDLEEALSCQEPPAAQPQEIQKQQVALQEIRQEIDQTKPEVEEVRRTGNNLMSLCGEPDKPEVKKHIEDLDHAWDNITALYAKREENLIDAMEKAMEFHETLQNLLKFLNKAEDRFAKLGPLGSDIDAVKKQIEQLKLFKDDVDPHMVEVEALNRALNRQAVELTERTSAEQAASIREPLNSVNRRWENLLRGMVERQKQLEHALLHLGQFQHALNELLVWIGRTDTTLDQLKPIPGDPQLLEVELAKLKVLANDIQAHQSSVDTLNDAGRQLIESEKGSLEASATQEKLRKLNDQWRSLLQKASDRQHELEEALREAQTFNAEVQDILGWLGDVDSVIGASKPVGGLPETATEQLERFMEVYNELEANRPKVETLQAQGQEFIKKQNQMNAPSSNLNHTLRTLKQRWDAVLARASDKKIKLEIALKEATEFHDTLQAFVEWLTSAEKQLAGASPVSRVLETIQVQIDEHKVLQKDISTHREAMLLLDKKGTHLKYFSQKQDVILIKNLLVSVQHRWERVVAKAAERTRALDHGYREAHEFHDAWSNLLQWLNETETIIDNLSEEAASSNDKQKIKKHLDKVKETQRNLSAKQGQYDTTMRNGKNLIDRAPKTDEAVLNQMLTELKETWRRVCTKSVDRQRKLEEALLLSGQFSEALQALLEWLRKTRARLAEQGPVHGDLETVTALVEHHKHLEQDLQKRAAQMQSVLKTGQELARSDDSREISKQLSEVQRLWEDVEDLSSKRGSRLQEALREAERLHKSVHMLLEWLSEAEQKLRYAQAAPDDENTARELLEMHTKFMRELREKERDKDDTLNLAQNILDKAHPDAIPIIKNWMTIIQSRWEEVSQWAIGRHNKLESQLQSLKDLDDTIEELLAWLAGLEATLINLEREPLPDEISVLEQLIADHKEFMENTARRQPEVDRACKPKQPLAGTKEARKPSRTAKTPVRGSTHDLREHSPDYSAGRKPSFKGSTHGLNNRRTSRVSPSRDMHTPERDRLPHYGPRFSPSSANVAEAEFRSPRAKLLWDKWRHVWMLAWERQRRLHEHLMYLQDVERVRQFSWDDWRKRFLKFMNHKKSRLTDLFRKMDKDNNGLIPREVFIDGIINTKFDTSRMEMGAVADLFDRNGEGLIDWQEFIAALRPDWQERKPCTDAEKIHDEVKRLVMLCTCRQKFRVFQVGEGKYRFGDSQKLRLVRILRSTVMVRVGGGWVALDEFLQKNDPCRVDEHLAELMPIFERLRAQEQIPCAYPLHMGAGGTVFVRSNNSRSVPLSPHAPHCHPSTHWVRERSARSVAMSRPSRSSLSASTPDSLSDNESSLGAAGRYTPRKPSYTRTPGLTPGGSRGGSKPNSRPASRAGSKPPSRHGSSLSLDSTDDTPTRIPQRRLGSTSTPTSSATGTTPRPSRLSVTSTVTTTTRTPISFRTNGVPARKTASGSASPAPTSRSRIPVRQHSNDKSFPSSGSSSATNSLSLSNSGRNLSGSSTPSGMQTPRKGSMEPPTSAPPRKSRGGTPTSQREPFRL